MTTELTPANILTFIKTDPLSVGFEVIYTAHPGEDGPLIDAANDASGPGSGTVAGDPVSSSTLIDMIDPDEFDLMTTIQLAKLQTIMAPGVVNLGAPATQSKLTTLFASYATSLATITAGFTRAAGPWEVYFGKGHTANSNDIDSARNITPGNPQF